MSENIAQTKAVERLLTVRQLAEIWGCCERTIRRKIDRKELEAVWLSPGAVRIRESAAARYVAKRSAIAA